MVLSVFLEIDQFNEFGFRSILKNAKADEYLTKIFLENIKFYKKQTLFRGDRKYLLNAKKGEKRRKKAKGIHLIPDRT